MIVANILENFFMRFLGILFDCEGFSWLGSLISLAITALAISLKLKLRLSVFSR